MVKRIASGREIAAIAKMLNYLWLDEERHFEERKAEGDDTRGHIFHALCVIDTWLCADTPTERRR